VDVDDDVLVEVEVEVEVLTHNKREWRGSVLAGSMLLP
jgi:hypothetical protein